MMVVIMLMLMMVVMMMKMKMMNKPEGELRMWAGNWSWPSPTGFLPPLSCRRTFVMLHTCKPSLGIIITSTLRYLPLFMLFYFILTLLLVCRMLLWNWIHQWINIYPIKILAILILDTGNTGPLSIITVCLLDIVLVDINLELILNVLETVHAKVQGNQQELCVRYTAVFRKEAKLILNDVVVEQRSLFDDLYGSDRYNTVFFILIINFYLSFLYFIIRWLILIQDT